jgi:hypothetical protein
MGTRSFIYLVRARTAANPVTRLSRFLCSPLRWLEVLQKYEKLEDFVCTIQVWLDYAQPGTCSTSFVVSTAFMVTTTKKDESQLRIRAETAKGIPSNVSIWIIWNAT